MFAASKTDGVVAGGPPPSGDPYWTSVSLLTNFENNLTFRDESTNNFAITRNGVVNPSLRTPFSGGVGGSEYFNGVSGSYLSVPRNSAFLPVANEDFTIEAWVYLTATPSVDAQIMTLGEYGTDVDWGLNISSSLIVGFYIGATIFNYTNTTALTLNTWNHVAASRSGTGTNNLKVFVNGVGASFTTNSTTVGTGLRNLTIGADQNGDESRLTGFLSNLRIVKGTAVYTANFTPPTAPLTAITNTSLLITGTGQGMFNNATFVDQGPNALTVTATGAPVYSGRSPFGNTYPGSVLYNGSSQYLSTPTNSVFDFGTGDLTMEAWIYITGVPAAYLGTYGGIVVSKNTDNTNLGFYLYLTATSTAGFTGVSFLQYYSVPNSESIARSFTFAQNTWYHLAVSKQSGSVKLFINGTQQGATATFTQSQLVSTAQVTTGGQSFSGGYNYYFPGNISNLRVVKGTAVYTTNFTPSTTPLTAITNTSLLVRGDTGAFYDLSNNGLAETGVGSPVVTTQIKKYGNESGSLNGSSYITVANNAAFQFGSGNFTIEFWIYPLTTSGIRQIINPSDGGGGTNNVFAIITNGTACTYYLSSTGTSWNIASGVSVGTVATNTWYHVALVRNGTTITPYLNGVAGTATTSSASLYAFTSALAIGAYNGGSTDVFNGYLDDIRITKGVARYTANFTPPTATFPTN